MDSKNFLPTIDVNLLFNLRYDALKDNMNNAQDLHNAMNEANIKYHHMFDVHSTEHKRLTNETVKAVCKLNRFRVEDVKDDPKKFLGFLFTLFTHVDFSTVAKMVIHFQLFGGTIMEVGTEYHHKKYFDDINKFNIVGGFAMTEMGHGSNVRQIETSTSYDGLTKELVINSPSLSSTKFWIGNVSMFGTHVVLFTKLIYKGEDKGVHVVVVPIRDPKTMELYPGIQLGDCGHKIGWNGIDNAWIRFKNCRVPVENLLNRFATITPDGEYLTKIASPGKLFQITISQLVFGRLLYICGPLFVMNAGLKTAIRYAFSRRQFGDKGKEESLIIDYATHHRVLLPMLATNIAFEFSRNWVIENLLESRQSEEKTEEYHAVVSGVKAMVTETCSTGLSKLRVLCGGNGISSYNYFGYFRGELDVFQTAEGDGNVLYQQLAKFLLKEYKNWYKNHGMKVTS
ncbi:hypothetical protein SAMD00019534_025790, partial [Acytostelium subglobosum LB1]|uniref:hypothetical protein n=1 Tax=Acytostelium subglobosum LB1 TaxID=1410327 RepID=UPI000644F462